MPASKISQFDDRSGNAFTIAEVDHLNGTASTFNVDQSAVTVAHLPTSGQVAVTPTLGASDDESGTSTFLKEVEVPSGSASGKYTVIVRHVGSAAGIGSVKNFGG